MLGCYATVLTELILSSNGFPRIEVGVVIGVHQSLSFLWLVYIDSKLKVGTQVPVLRVLQIVVSLFRSSVSPTTRVASLLDRLRAIHVGIQLKLCP